jgi:hypothetical protein
MSKRELLHKLRRYSTAYVVHSNANPYVCLLWTQADFPGSLFGKASPDTMLGTQAC